MTRQCMEFDEDHLGESRFWDRIFPQVECVKDGIFHALNEWNSRMNSFEKRENDVGSQSSSNNKIRIS